MHLHLTDDDIHALGHEHSTVQFEVPTEKVDRLEAIYHLVQMIYMDQVVEDVELEIATLYAEKLGFRPAVVAGLFQSIATARYDDVPLSNVRQEVIDFLNTNEI